MKNQLKSLSENLHKFLRMCGPVKDLVEVTMRKESSGSIYILVKYKNSQMLINPIVPLGREDIIVRYRDWHYRENSGRKGSCL